GPVGVDQLVELLRVGLLENAQLMPVRQLEAHHASTIFACAARWRWLRAHELADVIRACEVQHGYAVIVCDPQGLPGSVGVEVPAVEAAVGRPAHDELRRAPEVGAEHL